MDVATSPDCFRHVRGMSDKDWTAEVGVRAGENVERLISEGRLGGIEREVGASRRDTLHARLDSTKEIAASRLDTTKEIAQLRLDAAKETAGIREMFQAQKLEDMRFQLAHVQQELIASRRFPENPLVPHPAKFPQPALTVPLPVGVTAGLEVSP